MLSRFLIASAVTACLAVTASPALAKGDSKEPKATKRVVVLVSGTASTTPFTTPKETCRTGFSAGNTWAFVRDNLTKRGYSVFTAPVSVGGTKVKDAKSEYDGPFGECPAQLPAKMTANSIGSVDRSGSSLARFLNHLNRKYGVTDVDMVGHSLGGFIARAGIREARLNNVNVTFRSFATLGSPWDGTYAANPTNPADPLSACHGFQVCLDFVGPLNTVPGIDMLIAMLNPKNTAVWNSGQGGFLNGIPVTLFSGTYFTQTGGSSAMWPNDGIAQKSSALAEGVSDTVLPHRRCYISKLTHSLSISRSVGLPDDTALTWNADIAAQLAKSIDTADKALAKKNRIGCPS